MMEKKTPLEAGFIARAAAGLRFAFTGKRGDWFGPADPLPPVAPDDVKGRQFDYPFAVNLQVNRPKANEGVTFEQMRALADGYDLLRLVIEKRKDQLAGAQWTVRRRDVLGTKANEALAHDPRVDAAIALFRNPDRASGWDGWLRMLLEDLLVIDAPTLYVRRTRGGAAYSLEPVDGSTIKRVLDGGGRTPAPPEAAYQQVLKGLPAVEYTADELLYRPRNPRTNRVYGYSPVEQIIVTVNIALRRQAHVLEYYGSGSVPDALVGVPADWTPEQIQQWQEWWDMMLAGDLAARRKTKFVPGDLAKNFKETKQPPLKDMFDEWLARVVCFAFSIEPTPFVVQVNRATSEVSREQSQADGVGPLRHWVKTLVDDILAHHMGMPDLEFVWEEVDAVSPTEQAAINVQYVTAGILTADEVRADMGRDPLPEQPDPADNANGPPEDDVPEGGDDKQAAYLGVRMRKAAASKKALRPIATNRKTVLAARKALAAGIERFLAEQADDVAQQLGRVLQLDALGKAADAPGIVGRVLSALGLLDFGGWVGLISVATPHLRDVAEDAAQLAVAQVGGAVPPQVFRARATAWATDRAAEMVGMRWVGDVLIQNPNAHWRITEGTRQMLRGTVTQALEEGWSADKLASEIRASEPFSKSRARMIARTELAKADATGQLMGWQDSGLVAGKEWLTAQDEKVSKPCQACAKAGVLALDALFPSGEAAPPNHPNCRCTLLPVLDEIDKAYNPRQPRDARGRWTSGGGAAAAPFAPAGGGDGGETMTLLHTSPQQISEIKESGRFDDFLFFSSDEYVMTAGGEVFTYEISLSEGDILDASTMFYRDDAGKLGSIVREVSRRYAVDDDTAEDLISGSASIFDIDSNVQPEDMADAAWDLQRYTGRAAKKLGYKVVQVEDEQGAAYMVSMAGREKELKLVSKE